MTAHHRRALARALDRFVVTALLLAGLLLYTLWTLPDDGQAERAEAVNVGPTFTMTLEATP